MIVRVIYRQLGCAVVAFFLVHGTAAAQAPFVCGTSLEDLQAAKEQMFANMEAMREVALPRTVIYVPVRFWRVGKSDGSGKIAERILLDALCTLNENFADQNIQFYLKEIKDVHNTSVYDNPSSFAGAAVIKDLMIYNAINIFITNDAGDGAAAYWQGPAGNSFNSNDWIVCSKSYVGDIRVITHELGHFFSLPHPFHGWEGNAWDPNVHGNPVGLYAPDGETLNEYADGSNCQNAGDGICDTPADYLHPSSNCTYSGNAKDPSGQPISPDPSLHMNYHFGCDDYYFSDEQKMHIQNSLFSSARNYVRPNYTPNTAQITEVPILVAPIDNEDIPGYTNVILEWEPVPGADRYLVEIDRFQTFTVLPQRFIVHTNSLLIDELEPNKKYYWRVRPFNEYYTCTDFSAPESFRTGELAVATRQIESVTEWAVAPNPVVAQAFVRLSVTAAAPFDADLRLVAVTGQRVWHRPAVRFAEGNTTIDIPVVHLPAGLYSLVLQSAKGVLTRRIVIGR